jgi:hypothetical protein
MRVLIEHDRGVSGTPAHSKKNLKIFCPACRFFAVPFVVNQEQPIQIGSPAFEPDDFPS